MTPTKKKATVATAAGLAIACAFIQPWEGLWTTAKKDRIGTGAPVTWCYGETIGDVKPGQKFTPTECSDMLKARLPQYDAAIGKCIHIELPAKTRAAFISFAYNVGAGAFCKSAAAKRIEAGDLVGACNALLPYNHAQGRVVKGLTNRRYAERDLCLEGLQEPEPVTLKSPLRQKRHFFRNIIGIF